MEDGQKVKIALDSVLDSNTADMLCDINNPKLIFNRQVLQGGYLPTSVRFEHNGWFCGDYGYDYSIAAEEPIDGGILGNILVSKKSNYINCIYHCKSNVPEIQFDVYPETRIIKKEHYDYDIEHIFEANSHILKITGKTAILNNNYVFYIDITDLNNIKPARKGDWENVDPDLDSGYFTACYFMTEDLFKSGTYYTRKLINGKLQYTIANTYNEAEAYYKRIPVSNKFSFDPDKYIYSFKVYDQDRTFSDTISIYFGKTFYIGDDVYTYSMNSNSIKWSEYISCIYDGNKLTMITIEDSSNVQDVAIVNGNGMLKYAIDINATDTINITVDDYFMDINFSSGNQQKEYIGNTSTDNYDSIITSNYWYADFFNNSTGAVTCEVKLPVWIGLGVNFYGQKTNTGSTTYNSKYAQADVSNLYAIVHVDHYKNGEKQQTSYYQFDNSVLDRFILNNICTSPNIGYRSKDKATIDYNLMPADYKNTTTLEEYMNIYKCKNHIIYVSTTGGNVKASRYNYSSIAGTYDSNSDTVCTVTEIHDLIYSDTNNYVNTWYARFNEMHPISTVAISGVEMTHKQSIIQDEYVLSKLFNNKLIGYNYFATPGYKNSNKLQEYIFSFLSKNERLIKYDPVLHNAAIYPKPKSIPSYVPTGILDCTQGDPTLVMSYGKYYGSEDMVKAALNTFDFSSLIGVDNAWQTVADKYTLEKLAKVQIVEDGQLSKPYDYGETYSSNPWVGNSYTGSMYEECAVDYSIENFWPFSKVPCFNLSKPDGTVVQHVYYANEDLSVIIDNLEDYKTFIKNGSSFVNLPFVDNNTEGFRVYDKLFYDHTRQQHAYTTDFDTSKLNLYADAFGYVNRASLEKLDITVTQHTADNSTKTYNVFSDEVLGVKNPTTLGDYYVYRSRLATHIDMLGTTTKDDLGTGSYLKSSTSQEVAITVNTGALHFITTIVSEDNPTNASDDILFYIMYNSHIDSSFVYPSDSWSGPVNFDKYFRPVEYDNTMYMNFSPRCIEPYILSSDEEIYHDIYGYLNYGPRKLDGTLTCDSIEHYDLYNSKPIYVTDPIYPTDINSAYISLIGTTENDYIIDLVGAHALQHDIHSLCIINTEDSIFSCSVKYDSKSSINNDYVINASSKNGTFKLHKVFAYGSHYLNRIHSIIQSEVNDSPIYDVSYFAYNGSASSTAYRQTTTCTFKHLLDYNSSSYCSIKTDGTARKWSLSDSQLSFSHAYAVMKFFKESSPGRAYAIKYFCFNYGTSSVNEEIAITDRTTCSFYIYSTDKEAGSLIAPLYYQHILYNSGGYYYVDYAITQSRGFLQYRWHKDGDGNSINYYFKRITLNNENDGVIPERTIGDVYDVSPAVQFKIVEGILLENTNKSINADSIINYDVELDITYDTDSNIGKHLLIKSNDYSSISYIIKANLAYNINTGACEITNATFTDNMFYKTLESNSTKVTPITEIKKGVNNSTIYMAVPVWGYGKFTISINNDELDSKSSNMFDIKEADAEDRDPNKLWIDKDITGPAGFNSVTGIKCIEYVKGEFYPANVADWTDTIQTVIIHADSCWFYSTTDNDAVPSYINGSSNIVSGSDSTCASSMLGNNETLINTHWNITNYKMLLAASVNTTCAYYHNLCCVQGIHAYSAEIVFANKQQAKDGRITRDNYTPNDSVYINVKHVDSKFDYMLAYDMLNGTLDYKNIYESVNNILDPEDTTNGEVSNE